jgi:flagellar hook assembly protein FlgD
MLSQNRPNPFNQSTLIDYALPTHSPVEIIIYNSLGQVVRELVNEAKQAGRHQVLWDGSDDYGVEVASGIYFYTINIDKYQESKRMILIK